MLSAFFSLWDRECLPGKINGDLQSKIGDANNGDKYKWLQVDLNPEPLSS